MSFDLAVWYEPSPVTDAQAAATYRALRDAAPAAATHPAVIAVAGELIRLGFDPVTTATSAIVGTDPSRAAELKPIVRELAARHGLVCHNPQTGDTDQLLPEGHVPPLALSSYEDGRTVQPTWDTVEDALRRLDNDNWFVILERGEGTFVQAGFGDKAGTAHGWYLVERRDGAPDRHVRTTQSDLGAVIAAFRQFAEDDPQWDLRFNWRPIDA